MDRVDRAASSLRNKTKSSPSSLSLKFTEHIRTISPESESELSGVNRAKPRWLLHTTSYHPTDRLSLSADPERRATPLDVHKSGTSDQQRAQTGSLGHAQAPSTHSAQNNKFRPTPSFSSIEALPTKRQIGQPTQQKQSNYAPIARQQRIQRRLSQERLALRLL